MRPISSAAAIALSILVGWGLARSSGTTDAATVLRLDIQDLVDRSDWVVEGRVVERRTVERTDGGIDTEITVDLARDYLGEGVGQRSFLLPGGQRSDGSGMIVPGLPGLAQGEEVLLFLTEGGPDGRRLPVGLTQGKYSLLTDRNGVRRALRDGDATRLLGGRSADFGLESRPYAELSAEVEAAVNHRRASGSGSQDD
ncbi:hypothetical protein [Engelhardtia mirabilis]|uniref:Uncharacterized protein n=1 Tax=Engelhardtia mirabilis TaxID=2528011 RepID=A0A518BNW8_9BACT|nr:hypothetical protein Pla133_37760 [Planctomycetes bacterium Pla133]QDV03001.1 hypothetical protein Pla86_37750 [Planctomycetes bacterium Pla86]